MTVLEFPGAGKLPSRIERMMARALEIDAFLKQSGTSVSRHGSFIVIGFEKDIAAEEFEKVLNRGVRG